jgi:hypothetical protein
MEASESAHAEHNEHARRNAWTPWWDDHEAKYPSVPV